MVIFTKQTVKENVETAGLSFGTAGRTLTMSDRKVADYPIGGATHVYAASICAQTYSATGLPP